jgi:AcrR family transcriptional regulator
VVVVTSSPADKPITARSARTRQAVLDAAAGLLAQAGLTATTIDAIRDRSGVSKTTIYKHWPNRLCVAVDAFADKLALETSLPDTGTARGDFTEQLRRVSAFYASPIGRTFAQLLASAMQDPVAADWLHTRLHISRRHGIEQLWTRALSRSEVRDHIDPDTAMDLLFGPVMWRVITQRRALTMDETDRLADAALNGLLA